MQNCKDKSFLLLLSRTLFTSKFIQYGKILSRRVSNLASQEDIKTNHKRFSKKTYFLAIGGLLGLGFVATLSQYEKFVRFFRAAKACALISLDYKWTFRNLKPSDPQYKQIQAKVHQRSANRILKVCRQNAGCFVKAAQFIATLNHVLPEEYTSTLSVLQDKAPYMPYEDVKIAISQNFNCQPNDMFSEFDEIPIAAASLAQVHHAKLKTGQEVAVKIQYLGLYNRVLTDLWTIKVLTKTIGWLFPQFEFAWVVPEFSRDMMFELDFEHEAKNAETIAANFANNKQIKIPKIIWDYTTKNVLTMEWCSGVKINDTVGLKKLGLNTYEVGLLFTKLFCEQIFVHGFLHCDPHPGNIFVRVKKGTKNTPEIILLDHGLTMTIPNDVRIPYCRLWKAMIRQDSKAMEREARILGAGDLHTLFRFILTFRSENPDTNVKISNEEKEQLRARFEEDMGIVRGVLKNIPRELLLVIKTQALIRSVNREIGANVDRFVIMARYSVIGERTSVGKPTTLINRILELKELMIFDFMLNLFSLKRWLSSVSIWIKSIFVAPHTQKLV